MPNNSEPLTPQMIEYLYDQDLALQWDYPFTALADWAVLCLQTGFRTSQYAQAYSALHMTLYSSYTNNIDGTSKVFIHSNVGFTNSNKQPVPHNRRHLARFIHIKWSFF